MKKIILSFITIMLIILLSSCSSSEVSSDISSTIESESTQASTIKPEKNNYVSYNGKLTVSGTGLVNKYGEVITLKGIVVANTTKETFSYTLLKNLKEKWHANIIKVGVKPTSPEADIIEMLEIIDNAIKLDLYVDVIYWTGKLTDEEVLNTGISYFDMISKRYSNVDNILYEVANEPSNSWDEIKVYTKTILDTIKKNTNNPVILCPTTGHQSLYEPIESRFEYDNTLYVAHVYIGSAVDVRQLSRAYYMGIPVFVSEWSNQDDFQTRDNESTKRLANLLNKFNYSSTFFLLGRVNREGSLCVVKSDGWDDTLDDSTLTPTGEFCRDYLLDSLGEIEFTKEDYTIMTNTNMTNKTYLWSDEYRNKITKIITTNNFNIPKSCVNLWDITLTSSGKVIAYLIDNGNDTYTAYFAVDGPYFNISTLIRKFAHFESCEYIDLTYARTDCTEAKNLFDSCKKLKAIKGLDKFFLNPLTDISSAFAYLTNLEELDLTGVDLSNVTELNNSFTSCNPELSIYTLNKASADIIKNKYTKLNVYYKENGSFILA